MFALYLVIPAFLIIKARLALAGGAMLLATMIPAAIARAGGIDNPVLGLVTMLMLPLPLLILAFAALVWLVSSVRRRGMSH